MIDQTVHKSKQCSHYLLRLLNVTDLSLGDFVLSTNGRVSSQRLELFLFALSL